MRWVEAKSFVASLACGAAFWPAWQWLAGPEPWGVNTVSFWVVLFFVGALLGLLVQQSGLPMMVAFFGGQLMQGVLTYPTGSLLAVAVLVWVATTAVCALGAAASYYLRKALRAILEGRKRA